MQKKKKTWIASMTVDLLVKVVVGLVMKNVRGHVKMAVIQHV